jgi:hypothetical protein
MEGQKALVSEMSFDLNRYRLPPIGETQILRPAKRKRHNHPFLKGPIPLLWLETAAKLPGKCLHVGLALWYLAGVQKSNAVALGNARLQKLGVDRDAKARCLKALQEAGLITVDQQPGRNPRVTFLEVEAEPHE